MSKITVKQAAYWLSEAWGRNIPASRCRLRGNWLFVDDPHEKHIDCIYSPMGGDMWGEPWTLIKKEDSPFDPKWDKSILQKLDTEITEYQEETEH